MIYYVIIRSSNAMKCMMFLQDSDQSSLDWQARCSFFDESVGISRETCIPTHKLWMESLIFTLALQNPLIRKNTQRLGVI